MKEENGGERVVQSLNMVDKSNSPLQTPVLATSDIRSKNEGH